MSECPRWRLITAHYLNIPVHPDGTRTEWEHKETNRDNGRSVRKLYTVPLLLNPQDPTDHNHPGEIVVAHDVEGALHNRRDYIFEGEPTPDMEPLNDEAQAISDSLQDKWIHPVETLSSEMSQAEQTFMENMMKAFSQVGQPQLPNASVPREEYDELKERLAKLEALLTAQNKAPEPNGRRV